MLIKTVLLASLLTMCVSIVHADETLTRSERRLLQAFGPWPQAAKQDAGNELSGLAWAESLGEQLFNDTLFSGDNTRSCASCHDASLAFSDGRPVAIGKAAHVRNSQGLIDVAQQRWFGWDGGADSLWAATLRPILSPLELDGDIATIATRLRTVPEVMQVIAGNNVGHSLQNDETLVVLASKAIAAYVRTLTSPLTPFDEYRNAVVSGNDSDSNYPADARRGLSIFFGEANCHVCHFGPVFSNFEFHDTGRPFYTAIGEVDPGRYSGIERVRKDRYNLLGPFNGSHDDNEIRKTLSVTLGQVNFGQWRTPSLRNLVYTAPYMHDGSLDTLREVVDAYADVDPDRIHSDGEAIIRPLALDEQEREDLVAFLESLSAARAH